MSAPTTTVENGTGTISASGESSGLLIPINTTPPNTRLGIGVSGTFGTATLTIRKRFAGLTQFYPAFAQDMGSGAAAASPITLADNTNVAFSVDVTGCDAVEVYCPTLGSGEITIEEFNAALGPNIPPIVSVATSGQQSFSGATTVTSTSASALAVGANGSTNPVLKVDASAGSVATGIAITGAAAASGAAITVVSSGSNEALTIDAKGSGSITIGSVSTGNVVLGTSGHTLTLNNSTGAVTLAAGGLTLTSGSLTLTSGNATLTSGNLTLTSGNATLTSGNLTLSSGTGTITSTSANAFTVGANGATNPVLKINANTASVATGITIVGAAAAGGCAISVISSGTNENLTINAKGSGTVTIGGVSTGNVVLGGGGGIVVVPGTLTAGGLLTCAVQVATSGPLIYSGSGAPSISAAVKGSLYLRSDGSSTSTRAYIATDTAGTWTAITTAA